MHPNSRVLISPTERGIWNISRAGWYGIVDAGLSVAASSNRIASLRLANYMSLGMVL